MNKKIHRRFVAVFLVIAMLICAACSGQQVDRTEEQSAVSENIDKAVEDGEYLPSDFEFSGGSGRISIACTRVLVEGKEAYADIVFDSENYSNVNVGGKDYASEKGDGISIFTIPVELNREMQITGTTTAMSQPHDVDYTICVYLDTDSAQDYSQEAADGLMKSAFEEKNADNTENSASTVSENTNVDSSVAEIPGLTYERSMELEYATGFAVHYYSEGYVLINVIGSRQYLIVPEGKEAPEELAEGIVVVRRPLDKIFMSASAVMALFNALDSLDVIGFSAHDEEDWYIENVAEEMRSDEIEYAGKYNEPDYEMLVDGGCDLAVESTMILHAPEVWEMLESLGIPVFIDRSSYEDHPLGRTEWIKVYAAMLGKEAEAEKFFDEQAKKVKEAESYEDSGKTVAFFYISSDGAAVVRNTTDYIVKMIEMAGGDYIYSESPASSEGSNITITMEEFYAAASEADYIIYNSSITNPIESVEQLINTNELFADFKAVKNGNVWTTTKLLYQATDSLADFIHDVHAMISENSDEDMTFLIKLD